MNLPVLKNIIRGPAPNASNLRVEIGSYWRQGPFCGNTQTLEHSLQVFLSGIYALGFLGLQTSLFAEALADTGLHRYLLMDWLINWLCYSFYFVMFFSF